MLKRRSTCSPHPCRVRRLSLGLPLLLAGRSAQAAAFPSRTVFLIVPNEAGGGLDLVARAIADRLSALLGRPVVVANRSGASGTIGTSSVARAEPDGHTLLITGVGHLVAPKLQTKPSYDPLRDFEPVARLALAPNVLIVHQSIVASGLDQLLAQAGPNGTRLAYASAGHGHSSHLAMELLMQRTGMQWLHVPYRGTQPAIQALASGEVQLMLAPVGSAKAALATGRVRALAIANDRRIAALPDVPTFAEQSLRGADFSQWYGLLAPAGTPIAALDALGEALRSVIHDPAVSSSLRSQGVEPAYLGQAAFGRFLSEELTRLGSLIDTGRLERPPQ